MITGKASDLVLYLMQADKDVVWDLKEHKAKRTLSQNASCIIKSSNPQQKP